MIALLLALQDIVVQGSDLPYKGSFDAPGPGYLAVRTIEAPENFELRVSFRPAVADGGNGEARVSKGAIAFEVDDRYGANFQGAIKLRVEFSPETDPSEPNDLEARARAVEPGVVDVVLRPLGDQDVLRFTLAERGYVVCSLVDHVPGLSIECRLFSGPDSLRGVGAARFDVPGPVTIVVRDLVGQFSSPTPFKLKIETFDEIDVLEPNDAVESAAPLGLEEWIETVVAADQDVDCFRVEAPADGWLIPDVETPTMAIRWELHDLKGERVSATPPFRVAAGPHVVALGSLYGNEWRLEPFRVRVRFVAADADVLEPNDDKPARLDLDRAYRVTLLTQEDVDRFTVTPEKPGLLTFETVGLVPSPVLFTGRFGDQDVSGSPLTVRASGGPVVVELRGAQYRPAASDPFFIRAVWAPDPDPAEPNDTRPAARPLAFGAPVPVVLWPERDFDWFALNVPGPGALYAILHDGYTALYHAGVYVEVALVGPDGNPVGDFSQLLTDPQRTLRVTKPGLYHVRVSRPSGASLDPFHLSVEFLPDGAADPKPDSAGLSVFYLGIDLDESGSTALKLTARAGRGAFFSADNPENITERLAEVMAAATKEDPVSPAKPLPSPRVEAAGSTLWIAVVVGAFALIALVTLRRRRA